MLWCARFFVPLLQEAIDIVLIVPEFVKNSNKVPHAFVGKVNCQTTIIYPQLLSVCPGNIMKLAEERSLIRH